MGDKHETITDPNLFYCFVNIGPDTKHFRFFIVPSKVVSEYVTRQPKLWLDADDNHSRANTMRTFRIGLDGEKFPISTPTVNKYEDNWGFKV